MRGEPRWIVCIRCLRLWLFSARPCTLLAATPKPRAPTLAGITHPVREPAHATESPTQDGPGRRGRAPAPPATCVTARSAHHEGGGAHSSLSPSADGEQPAARPRPKPGRG